MTIFILGANGSGKSAYAESLIAGLAKGPVYYVATMLPYGEAGRARVDRHKKQRRAKGFVTVERPDRISGLNFPSEASVLLEDVSNLLGNTMFGGNGGAGEVFADIAALCEKCSVTVLVSIEGLTRRPEYDRETCLYIEALNQLNRRLSKFADRVIQMRENQPFIRKGESIESN